jgi:predicted helicase
VPDGSRFSREHAAYDLPKTNPFLRRMFDHIAGIDLDERITWAVDDLADLLARADMAAILADFGHRTRQEDPVVHFYETFLAAYDPKMREARGVYYTPEPVVSYLVRSADILLKKEFGLPQGLADSSKVKIKSRDGKQTTEVHKVQILDPATGTATFLHGVIDRIYDSFAGNKGMWSGYVRDHLLPRVLGFELLMAPYAVAHMKLGLQLAETGYNFDSNERLRVFLTNTLEEADEYAGMNLFAQWLADEANAASMAKSETPVMVVIGNPPYSGHSANRGDWIAGLLHGKDIKTGSPTGNYFEADGKPLGERNPKWLNDDYVKFIRFAQWRIERTGYGVPAFITNHGYLDNPTFRGMRQSLMQTFDDIYLLDLHGNSKKKEHAPNGGKDENVFDIQQGVAIGIFVKRSGVKRQTTVRHAHLWGTRQSKYKTLLESDVSSTSWNELTPSVPLYLFVPQDIDLLAEYEQGWRVTDLLPEYSIGCLTKRDALVIGMTSQEVRNKILKFLDAGITDSEAAKLFDVPLQDKDMWNVGKARAALKTSDTDHFIRLEAFRPFDKRFIFYHEKYIARLNRRIMQHLDHPNLALVTVRQLATLPFDHIWLTNSLSDQHLISVRTKEGELSFRSTSIRQVRKHTCLMKTRRPIHRRDAAPTCPRRSWKRLPDGWECVSFLTAKATAHTRSARKTCSPTCTPSSTRRPIAAATPSS